MWKGIRLPLNIPLMNQKANGLMVNGRVGKKTKSALAQYLRE